MLVSSKMLNFMHRIKLLQYFLPKCNFKNSVSCQYATLISSEDACITSSEYKGDSEDTFGSLHKSSKHSKPKYKTREDPIMSQNVKVIKIKRRRHFNQYDNADVFGNLSEKEPIWYPDIKEEPIVDNNLGDDSNIVRNISKKYRSPDVYLDNMKLLVSEKKLKEALDLFLDMRRNFVAPSRGHYTYMISACGKVGYTEMAFRLLRQMTDRKFIPTPATLTGLFNSCGESPFPEYGLNKALSLRQKIKEKNWILTQITYHAMIKAFGKCGDIQTAFQVVDEMAEEDIKINEQTYSFLLMSCISNKEAGFTHAIEVFRKMKERNCHPNVYAFNLLLRSARDCNIGPKEISCLLLQHWSSFQRRPYGFAKKEALPKEKELLRLESVCTVDILPDTEKSDGHDKDSQVTEGVDSSTYETMSKSMQEKSDINSAVTSFNNKSQNILSSRPINSTEILELGDIKTSSDRLALIGSAKGFLLDMKKNNVAPDIKTFTLLLECLPPNTQDENDLLELLDVYKVKPDVGFFNVLIKRRSFRFDHIEASKVLLLINKWNLTPDIITYGVLALGCDTRQKATVFINDLRKLGFSPNAQIIGSLLSGACAAIDFDYIENTLKLMEEEGIEPNKRMLLRLEKTVKNIRENIFDMEHGCTVPNIYKREGFCSRYKEFCETYEQWLKNIKFGDEEHVWEQYKTKIY